MMKGWLFTCLLLISGIMVDMLWKEAGQMKLHVVIEAGPTD